MLQNGWESYLVGGSILKPGNEIISGIGYLLILSNMTVTKTDRSTDVTEGLVSGFEGR